MCRWRREGRWALTVLPGPRVLGPAPLPPPPRPRLALGVLPQLLLMTCSCRSARSARSRSSSMNCCSRSLALASRAAVSFRNWSICTTSLGPEQSLYPSALAWLPTHPPEETLSGRERQGHSWPQGPLAVTWVHTEHTRNTAPHNTTAHTKMQAHAPRHTRTPHQPRPKHTTRHRCSPQKYSQACSVTHSHLPSPETLTGTRLQST